MDFEKFCNEYNQNKNSNLKSQNFTDGDIKKVNEIVDKYKDKSKTELLSELINVAKSEKAKGNLSKDKLEQIYSTFSPMLKENEKETFKNLIEMLGK